MIYHTKKKNFKSRCGASCFSFHSGLSAIKNKRAVIPKMNHREQKHKNKQCSQRLIGERGMSANPVNIMLYPKSCITHRVCCSFYFFIRHWIFKWKLSFIRDCRWTYRTYSIRPRHMQHFLIFVLFLFRYTDYKQQEGQSSEVTVTCERWQEVVKT